MSVPKNPPLSRIRNALDRLNREHFSDDVKNEDWRVGLALDHAVGQLIALDLLLPEEDRADAISAEHFPPLIQTLISSAAFLSLGESARNKYLGRLLDEKLQPFINELFRCGAALRTDLGNTEREIERLRIALGPCGTMTEAEKSEAEFLGLRPVDLMGANGAKSLNLIREAVKVRAEIKALNRQEKFLRQYCEFLGIPSD